MFLNKQKDERIVVVIINIKQKKQMQLFNICTKKNYETNGEQKIKWYKVGILKIADSGKKYIKFFHQPDTEFFVFDKDEKTQEVQTGN